MKILSMDCSTTRASACLVANGETVLSTDWFEERARHESLFEKVAVLMEESRWSWEDIDLFAVGRGPGAYSGLRVSLLAAQSLAAPSGTRVAAVSSMEALAARLMREHSLDEITIVGDARRQSIWHGTCFADSIQRKPIDWRVVPTDEASGVLNRASLIASPHRSSLCELLDEYAGLKEDAVPFAIDIARLAMGRISHGAEPDPLAPLYLHPAV